MNFSSKRMVLNVKFFIINFSSFDELVRGIGVVWFWSDFSIL